MWWLRANKGAFMDLVQLMVHLLWALMQWTTVLQWIGFCGIFSSRLPSVARVGTWWISGLSSRPTMISPWRGIIDFSGVLAKRWLILSRDLNTLLAHINPTLPLIALTDFNGVLVERWLIVSRDLNILLAHINQPHSPFITLAQLQNEIKKTPN